MIDKIIHVRITGRVQGVFYRAWTKQTADSLGLQGWVRNKLDGSVEALFGGKREAVEKMNRLCHEGPENAHVDEVEIIAADGVLSGGFEILDTD
ncbi:MAG: acylphosphatase [Methyloligellaceae bacterium]